MAERGAGRKRYRSAHVGWERTFEGWSSIGAHLPAARRARPVPPRARSCPPRAVPAGHPSSPQRGRPGCPQAAPLLHPRPVTPAQLATARDGTGWHGKGCWVTSPETPTGPATHHNYRVTWGGWITGRYLGCLIAVSHMCDGGRGRGWVSQTVSQCLIVCLTLSRCLTKCLTLGWVKVYPSCASCAKLCHDDMAQHPCGFGVLHLAVLAGHWWAFGSGS